jgi:outer membrane protein TolC
MNSILHKVLKVSVILILATINYGYAQEILGKNEAVKIALEYNFDIRTADNNVLAAKNNADIKNSNYLPSVNASSSANFSLTDTETTFQDGATRDVNGVKTSRYNATVGLNYTLFDGFGRENVYRSLKESHNISELQARSVIELALVNIFSVYYEIARLTENELNQKQTLDISRERLLRAKYSFDYGQNTQLDVLNAEVDYNSDSITYLTIVQQLENEKRNLNLLMGRDVEIKFAIDTAIAYAENIEFSEIKGKAEVNNVNILLNQSGLRNADYLIKSTSAASIPKVDITANYGANLNNLGPTSFADKQTLIGPGVGATLSWNIFDGGATNIRRQNSKINFENQEIALEQAKLNLSRNLSNAWNIYKTALFVLEAERTNLRTNQRNFDRTVEQHALGQITSIVFRQAQLNLLNAQLNYNRAKYSAKIAELALFQLSGDLLTATF